MEKLTAASHANVVAEASSLLGFSICLETDHTKPETCVWQEFLFMYYGHSEHHTSGLSIIIQVSVVLWMAVGVWI